MAQPRYALLLGVLLIARPCHAWISITARNHHDMRQRTTTRLWAKKKQKNKRGTSGGGGGFARSRKTTTAQKPTNNIVVQQLSSRPPIFTINNFLDPKLCAYAVSSQEALNEVGAHLQQQLSRQLFQYQTSVNDGLRYNFASSKHDTTTVFPDGLHMDTNNECIFRHVTCILYLNNVVGGGSTWFPLAESSTSGKQQQQHLVAASRRLLEAKIGHTRSCGTVRRSGISRKADGDLLEHCCDNNNTMGIKVQPQAGKLLVFFSRTSDGKEDVRAWHGGERILAAGCDKHILTLFKQVDYGINSNHPSEAETTFEGFLAPQISKQLAWFEKAAASAKVIH